MLIEIIFKKIKYLSEVGLDDSDANALHGGTAACLSVRNDFLSYPRLFWVDLKRFYAFIAREITETNLSRLTQIRNFHVSVSQIDVRSAEKPTRRAIKTCARHNARIQLSKTGLGFFLHQVTKEEIGLQDVNNSRLDLATEGWISNQEATRAIPMVIKTRAVHKGCILVSKNAHETFREHLSSEEIELQCVNNFGHGFGLKSRKCYQQKS